MEEKGKKGKMAMSRRSPPQPSTTSTVHCLSSAEPTFLPPDAQSCTGAPVSPGHSRLDDKGMAPAALAGAPVHAKIVSR